MFILFGTKGVTSTEGRGRFHCPQCGSEREYKNQQVRRYFTLFFIPVIPMDELGRYVECSSCAGTFKPEVLNYDPVAERKHFEAQFHAAVKVVMIHMLLADGRVEEAEIEAMGRILEGLTGAKPDAALLQQEVRSSAISARKPAEVAAEVAPMLNVQGRETVLRAAIMVADDDGQVARKELRLLGEIGRALELSGAHLKGLLMEAGGAA